MQGKHLKTKHPSPVGQEISYEGEDLGLHSAVLSKSSWLCAQE